MNKCIVLHSDILGTPIFSNPRLLKVWLYCLFKAATEPQTVSVGFHYSEQLESGQFVFRRVWDAQALNMSDATLYFYINKLEEMGLLFKENQNNKYTIITIADWDMYQEGDSNGK